MCVGVSLQVIKLCKGVFLQVFKPCVGVSLHAFRLWNVKACQISTKIRWKQVCLNNQLVTKHIMALILSQLDKWPRNYWIRRVSMQSEWDGSDVQFPKKVLQEVFRSMFQAFWGPLVPICKNESHLKITSKMNKLYIILTFDLVSDQFLHRLVHHCLCIFFLMFCSIKFILVTFHSSCVEKSHLKVNLCNFSHS